MTNGRDFDWIALLTALVLCVVGLAMIYSVFQPPETGGDAVAADFFYFNRQALWLVFGLAAMLAGYLIPHRVYESLAHAYYAVCVILLIAVLLVPSGQDTQRWLVLGPIRLQPSEFTKIAVVF
ncbi:MAG: FtsW/RodA/SpoVE family cell cycle protein, partial [Candidatus Krumholzibacteria bacterium]|nr:FtsW/RodA/SpoVE family cell cycle protein [Candidatus Krumholzibacteria bacterium]